MCFPFSFRELKHEYDGSFVQQRNHRRDRPPPTTKTNEALPDMCKLSSRSTATFSMAWSINGIQSIIESAFSSLSRRVRLGKADLTARVERQSTVAAGQVTWVVGLVAVYAMALSTHAVWSANRNSSPNKQSALPAMSMLLSPGPQEMMTPSRFFLSSCKRPRPQDESEDTENSMNSGRSRLFIALCMFSKILLSFGFVKPAAAKWNIATQNIYRL